MPVSALAKNIRRFHELAAIVKPAEKELEALKTFFRDQASPASRDTVWQDEAKGLEVVCTREEQTRVNLEELRTRYPEVVKSCEVTKPILKVTGRTMVEPVKAAAPAPKKAKAKKGAA